ncbi:hypothetical protein [Pseudomonas paralactis]|uniref:hypothetical protein n=1 Tax=Pseudomonas paralactis TaxID=1615673 RepID=UPI0034D74201
MSDKRTDSPPILPPTRIADLEPPPYNDNTVRPLPELLADVGVGIRSLENRLLITFESWTTKNVGDTYEWYMGDRRFPVAWGEIAPGQETQTRYQLSVLREHVPLGIVYPCYGLVRRSGPGSESTSVEETWFLKDTRPGGVDQDPGLPYHSALVLHLPEDLSGPDAVLDRDRASEGVLITIDHYPDAFVGDTLELYWNGHLVELQLDADQAEGLTPIEMFVSPGVIDLGGSGLLTIRFRIHDLVLNFSGEVQQWSQVVNLNSNLDPNALMRPHFLVDGTDNNNVDFDQFAESHFELEVVAPTRLPNGSTTPAGTQIVATIVGTREDKTKVTVLLPAFAARPGRSAYTTVENSILEDLINGSMQITYTLQFPPGTEIGYSQSLSVTVFGTVSNIPAVEIEENEGGLIDPAVPYLKVNFPAYVPYNSNYPVTLRFEAHRPGGGLVVYEHTQQAGDPPPPTRFRIVTPKDFLQFGGLGPIAVFFRVNDGVNTIQAADVLTVRESEHLIVEIGERRADLPAPQIEGVDENGNLDPADVIFQVNVTLPYTFQRDDTVVWRWVGSGVGGSTGDTINVVVGGKISFPVDQNYVDLNNNGSIRLTYSLIRGNTTLRSETLEVTVGKAIGELLRPEVLEASRHPDQLRPESATTGATIEVSFLNMSPSDRILAVFSGVPGIGTFEETKNGNTSRTVHFDVPSEAVGANILSEGRKIPVQYFVLRGTRKIPSPILDLLLLPLTTLPIPTIEGHDNPVLVISQLTGRERTLINIWLFIHRFQRIWMTYKGIYADGTAYIEDTYSENLVTAEGESQGIMPPTPPDLRRLKDGSTLDIDFLASFDRSTDKANAVHFRRRTYTIQALPGDFPHPFINGTTDTGPNVTVDPLPIEHNTTATVSYDGMSGQDFITFYWFFADGTFYSTSQNGLDGGTVVFNLTSAKVLHRSVNSTVCLKYSVVRTGVADPILSQVQTVTVNTIPAENLPQPLINNIADGGRLDLSSFVGDATASVNKWPLSNDGQLGRMTVSSEGIEDLQVMDGERINATEAANGIKDKKVLRDWLSRVPNNSIITVTFWVAYSGIDDKDMAVEFPTTKYTITYETLNIDGSTLYLSGWHMLSTGAAEIGDFPGAAFARQPKGGVPPYSFSLAPQSYPAATIHPYSGNVRSHRNGSTRVIVSDSAGASVSYPVTVSNCWELYILAGDKYPFGHHNFSERVQPPYEQIPEDKWPSIYTAYGNVPIRWNGLTQLAWITSTAQSGRSKSYNGNTGATQSVSVNENIRHSLCVVPANAS